MTTKELIEIYYKGFAQRVIGIQFYLMILSYSGDMTKTTPVVGKAAYIEVIKRFSQLFTSMRIKQMIVEHDSAV